MSASKVHKGYFYDYLNTSPTVVTRQTANGSEASQVESNAGRQGKKGQKTLHHHQEFLVHTIVAITKCGIRLAVNENLVHLHVCTVFAKSS